jgi:hypothetical protein
MVLLCHKWHKGPLVLQNGPGAATENRLTRIIPPTYLGVSTPVVLLCLKWHKELLALQFILHADVTNSP